MDYNFDTRWFRDIPAEEVENLKIQLANHKKTLDNLRKIVYNMVSKAEDVRLEDYESPSWAHKQAHRNGFVEALNSIGRLVTLDKEEQDGS